MGALLRYFFVLASALVGALLAVPTAAASSSSVATARQAWLPGLPGVAASARSAPARGPAPSVPLTFWTGRALQLIVKYRQNPLRAARTLAYVHVALHDALLLADNENRLLQAATAHRAASCMLAFLYPQETAGKLEAEGVAAFAKDQPLDGAQRARVETIARRVLDAAVARAWQDGAERVWAPNSRPPFHEGQWREAPPLRIVTPTEALAGEWKTWVLMDGGEVQPPAPPPPGSERERREMEEVLRVRRNLTDQQKSAARRWNLDQGTVTPPGVWNRLLLEFAREWNLSERKTISVLAALNVGMLDAFIACWRAKFTWWSQRPVTAIRNALDPEFLPLLLTPPFPGYVSGHATVSGAASTILGGFFPERRSMLDGMAQEAALSRLYGGIHIRADNDQGLVLGRAVGKKVLARLQLAAPDPVAKVAGAAPGTASR